MSASSLPLGGARVPITRASTSLERPVLFYGISIDTADWVRCPWCRQIVQATLVHYCERLPITLAQAAPTEMDRVSW